MPQKAKRRKNLPRIKNNNFDQGRNQQNMFTRGLKTLVVIAAAVALFTACGQKAGQEGGAGDASKSDASAVLAVVNGKNITVEDFKMEAASLSPMAMKSLDDVKNRQKFLDNLVDKALIVQRAESLGMEKDPEVAKRLNQIKSSMLLGFFVKKEVLDKVNVTDKDVKDYFDKSKDDLGSVRISHILVSSQKEAEEIQAKLKTGGDFKALVKQHSLDTKTKNAGGDLGFVKWEQFGSAGLKDAAFKLKPGEVSGIVQSQFGYHIMKVTEKKPATDAEFPAMKDALKEQATEKKKEETFEAIVKDLKGKAKVTTNEENLKKLDLSAEAETPAAQAPMAK
jgi:EpsD family peptidyl-prolyl cis-trans isomerase